MTDINQQTKGFKGGSVVSWIAPPLLSLLLFLAVFILPGPGMVLHLFAPLPLIYFFFLFGRKNLLTAVLLVALVVSAWLGFKSGIVYLLTHALMAFLISEMILKKEDMIKVVPIAAVVPFICTTIFFFISSSVPIDQLYSVMLEQAEVMITQTVTASKDAGMPVEQADALLKNGLELAGWIVKLLPGTFIIGYLILSFTNFITYRRIQGKYTFLPQADPMPIGEYVVPDKLILLLILSLAVVLFSPAGTTAIGANLLMVVLAVYALGGISVMEFFMTKFNLPFILRLMTYMLIIIQPFFLSMVAGFGLFDLWFDFRKIRKHDGKNDDSDKMEE